MQEDLGFLRTNYIDQTYLTQETYRTLNNKEKQGITKTSIFGQLDENNHWRKLEEFRSQLEKNKRCGFKTVNKIEEFWGKIYSLYKLLNKEQLKKSILKEPQIIDDEKFDTFDELWDEIKDDSEGLEAINGFTKDLSTNIKKNCPEILNFIEDKNGEPYLEFSSDPLRRRLDREFLTSKITDKKTNDMIGEMALILDKLMELEINDGITKKRLIFTSSKDRFENKARGYEIFENLKKNNIFIYVRKVFENFNANSTTKIINNNLILHTHVVVNEGVSITYGNKPSLKPKMSKSYNEVILEHSAKAANILKQHLIIGGQPIKNNPIKFTPSKNKLIK